MTVKLGRKERLGVLLVGDVYVCRSGNSLMLAQTTGCGWVSSLSTNYFKTLSLTGNEASIQQDPVTLLAPPDIRVVGLQAHA